MRAGTARANDHDFGGTSFAVKLPFPLRWMLLRPRDSLAVAAAGGAVVAILVNALFMQSGPHPAPIFANKPVPVVAPQPDPLASLMPHRRPAAAARPEARRRDQAAIRHGRGNPARADPARLLRRPGRRLLRPEDRCRDPRFRAGRGLARLGRAGRAAAGCDRPLERQGEAGRDRPRSDCRPACAERPDHRGAAGADRVRLRAAHRQRNL